MSETPASLLQRLKEPPAEGTEAGVSSRDADWTRFVDLYTPLIYLWACRAGLQAQDAADLVQDVFVTLLQKLPEFTYDPGRSFRAWLHAVTLNKWRDRQRRQRALPAVGAGELVEVAAPDAATALFEAEYRRHLVGRAVEIMQTDFQPGTWKAVWAVVVEEKPAAVVAAELGLGLDAVYAARSRVLRRLRQELAGLLD
jgi:RNA polymerase sigma-70 factor (ECF subfamily)